MFLLAFCLSYDFVYAVFRCATCFALMLPNFFAKENYTAILYSIAHGVLFLKASMRCAGLQIKAGDVFGHAPAYCRERFKAHGMGRF